MLILATVGVALTSVAIWSTIHAQNGFAEIILMLQGKPAFIPKSTISPQARGEGGPFTGGIPDKEPEGGGGGGGGAW